MTISYLRQRQARRVALAAALCVVAAVYFGQRRNTAVVLPPPPPGWTVVRSAQAVDALLLAGDNVWAGAIDAVWRLSATNARVLERQDCGRTISLVHALLRDSAGTLWIGHNNGLTRLDGQGCRTLTVDDGLPANRVNALLIDRQGRFWAGTQGGLARREGSGWKVMKRADGL
ncbi:MAG: hypothetical protein NTY38_25170, partial [Acidobacteria bacterium]|nr:hypothetical protein [Acidobacteriota bacterium]